VDSGANLDCTPEMLAQFAYMGSVYSESVLGIQNPRVGLLNNGAEDTKGTQLQKDTYIILKADGDAGKINFIGNVEGRDPILGGCEVVVCDGYSGNIFLKASEGTALFVMKNLKAALLSSALTKIAALIIKPKLNKLREMMNPDAIGGTVILGISKPVVKAHGSSNADAIAGAVNRAIAAVKADFAAKLEAAIGASAAVNEGE